MKLFNEIMTACIRNKPHQVINRVIPTNRIHIIDAYEQCEGAYILRTQVRSKMIIRIMLNAY